MQNLPLLLLARRVLVFAVLAVAVSCTTISSYDQTAYSQAVSAKVDALALMEKATGPYDHHQKDVETVTLEVEKAYEYDKGRPRNEVTTKQWDALLAPKGGLLAEFLTRWQQKGTISSFIVIEEKKQVGEAFDQIIQLEAQKIH